MKEQQRVGDLAPMQSGNRDHHSASVARHSPGPWQYFSGTHSIYTLNAGEASRCICLVTGARKRADGARDANGRLITAAPDLLAALISCEAVLAASYTDRGKPTAFGQLSDAELGRMWLATVEQARAAISRALT